MQYSQAQFCEKQNKKISSLTSMNAVLSSTVLCKKKKKISSPTSMNAVLSSTVSWGESPDLSP